MDGLTLVFWGAIALNAMAVLVNLSCAWRFRRTERRLRELSLWACMVEEEPEERER